MKKVFFSFIACLFVSLNMQSQVTGVQLSQDTIVLLVPQDTILMAHVQPYNVAAAAKEVRWRVPEGLNSIISTTTDMTAASLDTIFTFRSEGVGSAKVEAITGLHSDICVINVVNPASDITFNLTDTLRMTIDDEETINATITAINTSFDVTGDSVIWKNLNPEIVAIDTLGAVCDITALSKGIAKIVAKTYDYDGDGLLFEEHTDTCIIKVGVLPITDFQLNEHYIELTVEDVHEIFVHLEPVSGIDKSVEWKSLDYTVIDFVTLTTNNIQSLKAEGVGTTKVIAISKQSKNENPEDPTTWITDTCTVRVYGIRADGMSLDADTIRINRTESAQLIAKVTPNNTTDKTIEWSIKGPANIDISTPAGLNDTICVIDALWSDTTKIIAKSIDNDLFRDSCVVIVYVPVDSVVFKIDNLSISDTIDVEISDTIRMKAVVYPDTATIQSVTWTILDPLLVNHEFVSHDTVCNLIALKKGEARIYASAIDRDTIHADTCFFNIRYKPVTSISLNLPDTVEIFENEVKELSVSVFPYLAANDSAIWFSSDSSVIDILSTGNDTICVIQALGIDTAVITVMSKAYPNQRDACVFIVKSIGIEEVILPQDTTKLYLGHKMNLTASILPLTATNKSLTWLSRDPAIVEILSTNNDTICEILGKSLGDAMIYAVAHDGVAKDSCVVSVREQRVFIESDTTHVNGGIELSLSIPSGYLLSGSFELQLPKGFGLTRGEVSLFRTSLAANLKDIYDLEIHYINDSTYIFVINSIATPSSSQTEANLKLMDIIYTIYNNDLENSTENFVARIVDIVFNLSSSVTIEEDMESVVIKSFKDPTGNELIDNLPIFAYISDNRLIVNTDKAETITVYSLNGQRLFSGNKREGQTIFSLNTSEQILIVRGSSGWVNKVANK